MPILFASTALLLLATAPAPSTSPSSGFRLHEGLPAGFKVDGKLDEWKKPPSVLLGRANQVGGTSRVASPEDLSAKVWLALGTEGLAVAGEVRDDHVQLATEPGQLNDDHVELWLALPQPKLPTIAYVNQWGTHPIPTDASCKKDAKANEYDVERCHRWWSEQVEYRKQLLLPFTRQYRLLSGSVVSDGQGDTANAIRYELMDGGYRFEALIPASAFPRTAQAPLGHVKVLVDLIDGDELKGELETLLSSSPRRKAGDPSTFHAVTLATPLRFAAWPELFERALKANASASYQPGPAVQKFQAYVNESNNVQTSPEVQSPTAFDVDLSQVERVGSLGDVELSTVPAQIDGLGNETPERWMVSHRGQRLLDTQNIRNAALRHTLLAPGLRILRIHEDTQDPHGWGSCGACPQLNLSLVTMNAQGRFSKPKALESTNSMSGAPFVWQVAPDLSRIDVSLDMDDGKPPRQVLRWTLDSKTGGYTKETFPEPPEEEAEDTEP